jgi:ribosomal protein S18 acetylase RimI-like enzyme
MALTFPSLLEAGLELAAAVMTRGFADYFVTIRADAATLAAFARVDGVDLAASRVALRDGTPVAGALVARRGWSSRLAGMSVVPEARGTGVGRALVDLLLSEARARGERAMELEVIEQNAPAVHLYESAGFQRRRRLVGALGRPPAGPVVPPGLTEVDPRALAAVVAAHGWPDLPWQVSAETLAHATPPAEAWRLGPAWALVALPSPETLVLRAVVTESATRRQGHARALLRALMARHPGREWRASALFPEEIEPVFAACGLVRAPLTQWQMVRPLR